MTSIRVDCDWLWETGWVLVMIPVVWRRMNSSSLAPPPRRSDWSRHLALSQSLASSSSSSFFTALTATASTAKSSSSCLSSFTFVHRHGIGLESSCRLDSATCTFRGQFSFGQSSYQPYPFPLEVLSILNGLWTCNQPQPLPIDSHVDVCPFSHSNVILYSDRLPFWLIFFVRLLFIIIISCRLNVSRPSPQPTTRLQLVCSSLCSSWLVEFFFITFSARLLVGIYDNCITQQQQQCIM